MTKLTTKEYDRIYTQFYNSYQAYLPTFREIRIVSNFYHNRQYTLEQTIELDKRRQPKETFNIIKLFTRVFTGYFSQSKYTFKTRPLQAQYNINSKLLNDSLKAIYNDNNTDASLHEALTDLLKFGLSVMYMSPQSSDTYDEFDRPINKIKVSYVPAQEVILDYATTQFDSSDLNYLHRIKFVTKETLLQQFPELTSADLKGKANNTLPLGELYGYLNYNSIFKTNSYFEDLYALIHTVEKKDGKVYSYFWLTNSQVIMREELDDFPYVIQKLHTSTKPEYYGIFRELIETQNAINQSLIKIQLLLSTEKIFLEDGAVADIQQFITEFSQVNSIVQVKDLKRMQVVPQSRKISDEVSLFNQSIERCKQLLGINNSFLGNSTATASGYKVDTEKRSAQITLRYIDVKLESFYYKMGIQLIELIRKYFTAHQFLSFTDTDSKIQYIELNKPVFAQYENTQGQLINDIVVDYKRDKQGNKIIIDDQHIVEPVNELQSVLGAFSYQLEIIKTEVSTNPTEAIDFFRDFLNGPISNALLQTNPPAYFEMASLALKNYPIREAAKISEILSQTAEAMRNAE